MNLAQCLAWLNDLQEILPRAPKSAHIVSPWALMARVNEKGSASPSGLLLAMSRPSVPAAYDVVENRGLLKSLKLRQPCLGLRIQQIWPRSPSNHVPGLELVHLREPFRSTRFGADEREKGCGSAQPHQQSSRDASLPSKQAASAEGMKPLCSTSRFPMGL